ncbi:MAG: GIY-YIG nuclease family protein [Chitinophagaceae bacterium]|nr:MAG: GIY-YIG nuclease family protein [Chitinophagaceae bacterium]
MYHVYVIKSIKHDYYYKGHCSDLDKRILEHNSGKTQSNKPYLPFRLVYSESFAHKHEAIAREKFFKTAAGRRFLRNKLQP